MPRNSRMSRLLHVLIHMDRHVKRPTSEVISKMLNTNPVTVRKMMAGLRKAGYVISEKGHGGGWEMNCKLSEITLFNVYLAAGKPALFSISSHNEKSECLVEKAVGARLTQTFQEAEALILRQFKSITLADIAADFDVRMKAVEGLEAKD